MTSLTKNQSGKTPAWLFVIIIFTVSLVAWLTWQGILIYRQRQGDVPAFVKPLPAEVYTYSGEVTSIGVKRFTILVSADRNYFTEDKNFTVEVSGDTIIIISTPGDASTGHLVDRRSGTFEDLTAGDHISVTAAKNIKGKENFLASKIEIAR